MARRPHGKTGASFLATPRTPEVTLPTQLFKQGMGCSHGRPLRVRLGIAGKRPRGAMIAFGSRSTSPRSSSSFKSTGYRGSNRHGAYLSVRTSWRLRSGLGIPSGPGRLVRGGVPAGKREEPRRRSTSVTRTGRESRRESGGQRKKKKKNTVASQRTARITAGLSESGAAAQRMGSHCRSDRRSTVSTPTVRPIGIRATSK